MDVHRDFCEIAIAEAGHIRSAGRVATDPQTLELFARSPVATDEVAIEAMSNTLAIARIVEPHLRRVVLVNTKAVREKTAGTSSGARCRDREQRVRYIRPLGPERVDAGEPHAGRLRVGRDALADAPPRSVAFEQRRGKSFGVRM